MTAFSAPVRMLPRIASDERPWLGGALVVLAASLVAAAAIAIDHGLVLAFGDAPSHVLIPRRVLVNDSPSLAQLGTHWGPLYHVLQLPFAWSDPLVRNGVSGMLVSMAGALVTGFFLYRLARLVEAPRSVAVAAVLLLALSPSFAYAGVIPMLYATVTATVTANVYFLTRWTMTGSGSSLLLAGLALTMATLTHFETWVLVPIELVIVIATAQRRWASGVRTRATATLWILASGYGVAAFFLMNLAIYREPFAFLKEFEVVAGGGVESSSKVSTDSAGGGGLSNLLHYPEAAWTMVGPVLGVAAVAGIAAFVWRWRRRPAGLTALLLLYPFAWFSIQAPTVGDWISPADTLEDWGNLRYATTIIPAAAFFAAVGLHNRFVVPVVVALAAAFSVSAILNDQVATWVEARGNHSGGTGVDDAGRWLGEREGGRVLVPVQAARTDRFELRTGLSDKVIVDLTDGHMWRRVIDEPAAARGLGVRWIVWIDAERAAEVTALTSSLSAELCYDDVRKVPRVRIYAVDGRCGGPRSIVSETS